MTVVLAVLIMCMIAGGCMKGIMMMTERYGQYWTKEWVAFGVGFIIVWVVYFKLLFYVVEQSQ